MRSVGIAKRGLTAGVGNAAKAPSRKHLAALGELLGRESEPTVPDENWDERLAVPCQVSPIGGGKYQFAWRAVRAGKHSLIAVVNGQVLSCSRSIDVHADGAVAQTSEVQVPAAGRLLPQQWNILQLRCRDAQGNPSELSEPSRLAVTCDGLAGPTHIHVRERPGLDGAYEVLLFGDPVGPLTLFVTLDGRNVIGSPAQLEVTASAATAGRCYAFGPGLGSKGPIALGTTARFTIVSCDVTGTRRRVGGDPFKVVISPRQSAHHLALRVKIADGTNGAYAVSWSPPFSGGYLISITLRGLPIFGSPFKVNVTGGGQYAERTQLNALGRLPADPTSEEMEAEIAATPSPTLHRLRSVPAEANRPLSPTTLRAPGGTTAVHVGRGEPIPPTTTVTVDGGAAPQHVGAAPVDQRPRAGSPSKTGSCADVAPLHRACGGPYSALSAAALQSIGSPSAREGVERAIAAARREGLGDLLQRLKRAVVEDDANDEHRAALHGMDTGAAGMRVDEIDAEETAGDSTSQAPFTPRAERSGAAVPRSRVGPGEFSPD